MHKWTNHPFAGKKTKINGQQARERLIKSNLKLVIKIAKNYRGLGLDFADLISEGNIGLMQGIEKYNPEKGAKISYYVSFWIKQSIRRAISNKGRTIRLPVAVIDTKIKILKFVDRFEEDHSRKPTAQEISESLGVPVIKVKSLEGVSFQCKSLNEKMGNDGESSENEFVNIVENIATENPFKCLLEKNEKHVLNLFLKKLDIRQQYIIKHRFGLGDVESQTLEVIGKKFNLTRERIRQLETIALNSLRVMYGKIKRYSMSDE
jgi:RNA polymerase primary sigma factor